MHAVHIRKYVRRLHCSNTYIHSYNAFYYYYCDTLYILYNIILKIKFKTSNKVIQLE